MTFLSVYNCGIMVLKCRTGGDRMQVIITAYDGTDSEALARRMAVRPRHLENMKKVMQV